MKKTKIAITIMLISIFILSIGVPFVHSGSLVAIFTNTNTNSNANTISTTHPSGIASPSGVAVIFNASQTGYLTSIDWSFWKTGYPTGTLICYLSLASVNATDGTAVPTGSFIEQSNNRSVSDVTWGQSGWLSFSFSQTVLLTQYQVYAVYVVAYSYSGVTLINDYWSAAGESGATYHNGGWDPSAALDFSIRIYGNTESLGGTPTPYPSSTTGSVYPTSEGISAITGYLIALFIILLPAGLMYWFKLRSVGFMITGLAIGAGLGYLTMPATVPLWLLFVMIMGIVGNFFRGAISGGNSGGESE